MASPVRVALCFKAEPMISSNVVKMVMTRRNIYDPFS